jgi:hypothetical protein
VNRMRLIPSRLGIAINYVLPLLHRAQVSAINGKLEAPASGWDNSLAFLASPNGSPGASARTVNRMRLIPSRLGIAISRRRRR